jgi:UDP-N-acetylglucosamine 2-epimerase
MGYQMQYILNSLLRLENSQTVVIYPNNDLGSDLIIGKIKMFERESYKNLKIFKNLDRIEFLSLLKQSDLMVGNSSSGIIDSASFHLPVINIGKRNFGRESAENVINISYKGLDAVLDIALSEKFKLYCRTVKNPYGDGNASEKIVKVLEDLDFDGSLLRKRFIL